jgi:hypothetical protein
MRTLLDHKLNELNDALQIEVVDELGQGGANHEYVISLAPGTTKPGQANSWRISFQNGPIKEAGFNGISQEALLAIIIDRLQSFQTGPYACRDNAVALTKCEEALMWLQRRTQDRLRRGVEGTNQK